MLPLCWAVKERLVGLAPIAGGTDAAVTVKLTGTVTVEAPVALRVITPGYVPVAKELSAALTVTVPLPAPEAGETVSHETLSLAAHDNVLPPVLLIVRV